MRVTHLQLTDFRSYESVQIEFGEGVTTLVGRNGHGKTNVVESVRYLSTLSSHRVASDAPLVRSGASNAVVAARVQRGGRSLLLEVTIVPGKANAARLNRAAAKPRDLVGILRTVIFAPEDLVLVKGDPGARRSFLDELCVALQPAFAGDLADYDRVVRQRTSLLKSAKGKARFDELGLAVWDDKLARLGARIMKARLSAVESLSPHVTKAYADVAPGEGECTIAYATALTVSRETFTLEPSSLLDQVDEAETERVPPTAITSVAALADALTAAMGRQRQQELDRGVCLVGPHRDDLDIRIGSLPARGYASHGESWSCALALKIAVYDLLVQDGDDGEPVLILDDVFAELDAGRRRALAGRLLRASQVIITAAVAADVPPELQEHPGGNVTLLVTPGLVGANDDVTLNVGVRAPEAGGEALVSPVQTAVRNQREEPHV